MNIRSPKSQLNSVICQH